MYSFLPNQHVVHGIVISWQPEIIFFLSMKTSRSNGITQEMIDGRWLALKQVRKLFPSFFFPASARVTSREIISIFGNNK